MFNKEIFICKDKKEKNNLTFEKACRATISNYFIKIISSCALLYENSNLLSFVAFMQDILDIKLRYIFKGQVS